MQATQLKVLLWPILCPALPLRRGRAAEESAFAQSSSGQCGAGDRSPGATWAGALVLSWSCKLYAGVEDMATLSLLPWCRKTQQVGRNCQDASFPFTQRQERRCAGPPLRNDCPGSQLLPLRRLQTMVAAPGVVSMFCCELTSYFKVENVFNFQLQPLDLILSFVSQMGLHSCSFWYL